MIFKLTNLFNYFSFLCLVSLDVNSATKLHQKQISPNYRSGLQQSLRDAILGGSGGSSNGDGSSSQRDMVRIGKAKNLNSV